MANFTVSMLIRTKNLEKLGEIQARLKDFSIPLSNIIGEWAADNKRKFAASRGAEDTGADEPPSFWDPLKTDLNAFLAGGRKRLSYQIWKRRKGMPDWLMVATGALMESLIGRGNFGEYVDESKAVFGTPLDPKDAMKAAYNFEKRPTIFLGRDDRNMIRRQFQQYLSMGDNYKELLLSASSRKYDLEQEFKALDMRLAQVAANG